MKKQSINICIKLLCLKAASVDSVLYIFVCDINNHVNSTTIKEVIPFCTYGKGLLIAIKKVIDIYETRCDALTIYCTLNSMNTFINRYKKIIEENNIDLVSKLDYNKLPITKSLLTCLLNRPKDISKVYIGQISKAYEYNLLSGTL